MYTEHEKRTLNNYFNHQISVYNWQIKAGKEIDENLAKIKYCLSLQKEVNKEEMVGT